MKGLLSLSTADLTVWLGHWWWPFVRMAAAMWMLPIFGDGRVTPQIRILLAGILGLLVAPLVTDIPKVEPFSLTALVITVEQIVFGVLFGLCVQLLFMVLSTAGQILSMQMGLGMAVMNDPSNGDSAPIISQLMGVFCTLLFLVLNGHLVVLELLVQSFRFWSPGASLYQLDWRAVIGLFGWSISASLALTLPAVVAMLMVNLTFGIMNRSAPSLNIISLGFPMTLMLGLVTLSLSVAGVPARYLELVSYVFTVMAGAMNP